MSFKKILCDYVNEMYPMEKGVFIARPEEKISIGDCSITRRQIKHVVEQRKAEGKSLDEVNEVIGLIPETIIAPDFEMPNYNPKYAGSMVRAKVFNEEDKGIVVVLDKARDGMRDLITAHLYSPKKIYLLKKKLHASAAGKTPHS